MKNTQKQQLKSKVVPLGDRVLVRPAIEIDSEKTKSGILIPDTVQKEKPAEGEVVAIGEGKYDGGNLIPLRVKVGDRVMFSKYGYDELKVDGKEYYIVKEENILAIIK